MNYRNPREEKNGLVYLDLTQLRTAQFPESSACLWPGLSGLGKVVVKVMISSTTIWYNQPNGGVYLTLKHLSNECCQVTNNAI